MFLKTTFFIVLPALKRYFSCASTVTNMRDSSSSTSYDCLQIVACSQFLGVVTIGHLLVVCLFLPSCCFQGLYNLIVCLKCVVKSGQIQSYK